MKVILFNGPPNAGKDDAAEHLAYDHWAEHVSFKKRLIELTCMFFDVTKEEWEKMYTREEKEKPQEKLRGYTPRQALIHVSENVMKIYHPYGKEYFGKHLASHMRKHERGNPCIDAFVASDSGFVEEANVIINEFGAENVFVVRIHRDGCTFEGDSRRFLTEEDFGGKVKFYDIYNKGSLEEYLEKVRCVYYEILEKK